MSAKSRSKGRRAEQELVNLARAAGLDAVRTWHTAQSPDAKERACDVQVAGRHCQVKVAADGYKNLYDSLGGVELLFVRADRREWLVALRASDYLELLRRATCLTQPY